MIHRFVKERLPASPDGAWAKVVKTVLMFQLVCLGWLIFRADSFGHLSALFLRLFSNPEVTGDAWSYLWKLVFYASPLVAIQLWQYRCDELTLFPGWSPTARAYAGAFLLLSILCLGQFGGREFIYFQF
jgi:hypothetical protein